VEISNEEILQFINAIKSVSKYDFSDYTDKSFRRRVEKVVTDNRLDVKELLKKLESDKTFLERVVKDITVNTTELLRDPNIWINLKKTILPELNQKERINIWHAGCSSGQEVYSMLILLNEMGMLEKTNVFGTDLNTDILEEAKKGVFKYQFNMVYFENFDAVLNNPEELLLHSRIPYEKYFDIDKNKDTITCKEFLKKKPFFRFHDLVNDDNVFGIYFDLIMCRNVLIYFNNQLQNRVFDLFHKSLVPNGHLIIGVHESILGPYSSRYDKRGVYYRRKEIIS
jgi:chemotaxis protein methyltransferase CheR